MGNYKLINNALGWIVFAIASCVYLMTIEPSGSFWDCGEFVSSAYKLEVGHPPGAPFFMLTANLFTQLASDPGAVAKMVNTMSALFSGLTILFLFWSITHLARKIVVNDGQEMTPAQLTEWVKAQVEADGLLKVIYFQAVDATTMQQVSSWEQSDRIQGCIAVQAGDVRLIDNIRIK